KVSAHIAVYAGKIVGEGFFFLRGKSLQHLLLQDHALSFPCLESPDPFGSERDFAGAAVGPGGPAYEKTGFLQSVQRPADRRGVYLAVIGKSLLGAGTARIETAEHL